jgi:hypothetical protein
MYRVYLWGSLSLWDDTFADSLHLFPMELISIPSNLQILIVLYNKLVTNVNLCIFVTSNTGYLLYDWCYNREPYSTGNEIIGEGSVLAIEMNWKSNWKKNPRLSSSLPLWPSMDLYYRTQRK